MHVGDGSYDVSDYSNLTAGQYQGQVLKRERNFTWRQYWCVLRGHQLTFYDDEEKHHVRGRIEIQPGSRCDKLGKAGKGDKLTTSLAELFHTEYRKVKKYPLRLKTKKGTYLFTYEDLKEQSRWQMAMNNASQEYASGVRLSWIPTPFSYLSAGQLESELSPAAGPPSHDEASSQNGGGTEPDALPQVATMISGASRSKSKSKREDTRTLMAESDSDMSNGLGISNASMHHGNHAQEFVTSL